MSRKRVEAPKKPIIHPVQYVDPAVLKKDPSNPRKIEKRELERLAINIAKFGFVESVTACLETNELIGGHQRVEALKLLSSGAFIPTEKVKVKGEMVEKPIPHDWTGGKKVPVVYVEGLSRDQIRRLNISLNRIGGEWDYEKLISEIKDSYTSAMELVADPTAAIEALMDTGFMATEIADFIDIHKSDESGMEPEKTTGTPKLTLEFTSKESRDAFKAYVAECNSEGVPSGDALAAKLGVTPLQSRKRKKTN
jgi:ParB-like chromosome segregation protein Spo0J